MKLKIKIEESNNNNVRATMYTADTNSNVGTLWMTRTEFDQFINMLSFGIDENSTLEVDDPATNDYIE
jgi:hypothetical protein